MVVSMVDYTSLLWMCVAINYLLVKEKKAELVDSTPSLELKTLGMPFQT